MRAVSVVGLVPFGCYLVELFHVMSLPIGPQLLHGGLYLALYARVLPRTIGVAEVVGDPELLERLIKVLHVLRTCLLYTSDAADDLLCVDLGGRRIIKKKKK